MSPTPPSTNAHGGNLRELAAHAGRRPEEILDFSASINPHGPPESLRAVVSRCLDDLVHYPDPDSRALTLAIAGSLGQGPANVVAGNGTSELLFALPRALEPRRMLIPTPAYVDYANAGKRAAIPVHTLPLREEDNFRLDVALLRGQVRPGDLVIIGRPNNPSGQAPDREELLTLARSRPEALFVIDEAFAGLAEDCVSLAGGGANVLTLNSLTKLFAIPGLRLGYLTASAALCAKIRLALPPWSVNAIAQAVGIACLEEGQFVRDSLLAINRARELLTAELAALPGLAPLPSITNFLLVRCEGQNLDARTLAERLLLHEGIAIRVCDNFAGLDRRYFRVAVRTAGENARLIAALEKILAPSTGRRTLARPTKSPTPAIMFQGSGSDVGKSVLTAGLCRILLQDGLRVAPFKAQNMSLNSFVTRDGGEMGRAQVVQAQACRLDPETRMNPVLLKPASDVGSQVIVNGRSVGNMRVREYLAYKGEAFEAACRAYDSLAAEFDVVVLEGAGSPGEVNLRHHDIVNMRMARHAGSPVLLVGDIDRGGVYASFIGHFEVMAPWERDLLAGFVVNRFRGDASLLADAHDSLRRWSGREVLGVVPWLADLGLPQEDSVSFKAGLYEKARPRGEHVEIVLIDLAHVSNFTDVEPLLAEPDVYLRVVRRAGEIGEPDALVLPGSKNVAADLEHLRRLGLDREITALAAKGCEIVGICGGFQMLGQRLADPHGIEAQGPTAVVGLGLIDLDTVLAQDKTLIRREGLHLASGRAVRGYEIHHGLSRAGGGAVLRFNDGAACGRANGDGRIWGAYLHGIFDSDEFRRWFIDRLRARKGLAPLGHGMARYDLEPALDRLAEVLRGCLDLESIYRLLAMKN